MKFEKTHGEFAHGAGEDDDKDIEVIVDPSAMPTRDGKRDDDGDGYDPDTDPDQIEVRMDDDADDDDEDDGEDEPRKPKKGKDGDDEEYSRRVKKRIDKMRWQMSEVEREREELRRQLDEMRRAQREAQREREEAEAHALAVREDQLKTERKRIQRELKDALERGDVDAIYEANEAIARVVTETQRVEYMKSQISSRKPQADEDDGEGATPGNGRAQQKQLPAPSKPNPKALKWASENAEWFQKDDAMTGAAYAIDRRLQGEGYDPTSDEYYAELNRRIRAAFPQKFKRKSTRGGTVAPVGNRGGKDRPGERVRLTASELEMARKLGVPPKIYAKYKEYE